MGLQNGKCLIITETSEGAKGAGLGAQARGSCPWRLKNNPGEALSLGDRIWLALDTKRPGRRHSPGVPPRL